MQTVVEVEDAFNESPDAKMPKATNEGPDLPLKGTFYPFGFAIEVKTNSEEVLAQYGQLWGEFKMLRETPPIPVEVQVVETDSTECPPATVFRIMRPYLTAVADQNNFSVVDLERSEVRTVISQAALRHPLYAQYFILGTPGACVACRHVTVVHGACVSLNGRGIMFCGDSGAGKSTLSYACARAGFTYVSDDGCFLENGGSGRLVTGDCYRVRFRPTAADLFPELQGLDITPRAAGKPSIELSTLPMKHIIRSQTARIEAIVFLNRRSEGDAELLPFSKDAARRYMWQTLFGSQEMFAVQSRTIEQLLDLDVQELRYSSLDSAIGRVRKLLLDGR
jgi:hypothetical protein